MLKGRFERIIVKGLLWLCIVFVLGVAVFLSGAVWEVKQKQDLAWQERNNAGRSHEELEERKSTLLEQVSHFESERGLEEEFRKRFPVAKEGEEVIVLIDPQHEADAAVATPPKGVWATLRSWLGF